jgi:hypothetical protein
MGAAYCMVPKKVKQGFGRVFDTTGLGRFFTTRTYKYLSNILFVDWEEKTPLESNFKVWIFKSS